VEARAAGQNNNATARLGAEVLLARVAPRAKVARPVQQVDKVETLVLADGRAVLAVNSRAAAALWGPAVLRPLGALPVAAGPLVLVAPRVLVAFQAQAVSPEREGRAARAVRPTLAAWVEEATRPQPAVQLQPVALVVEVAGLELAARLVTVARPELAE